MQLQIKHDLPFLDVTVAYQENQVGIPNVLVDTGSATSIFNADIVREIGLLPEPNDPLITILGIGGNEVVFSKRTDFLRVGEKKIENFQIEIGSMDYGFDIQGILGMDFLVKAGAIIDLVDKRIEFGSS